MRMLEGKSTRSRGIEGRTLAVGQIRREIRVIARLRGVYTLATDQAHGVVLQVVRPGTCPLIRIGDRTAVLQTPFASCRNGSIDATRAGRGCGNDATIRWVKAVRYLHHHGNIGVTVLPFLECDIFAARNEPWVGCRILCSAVRLNVGPI